MFTGIIEATAAVREKRATGLIVERPASFDDLRPGGSVCVNGVCLTIAAIDDATLSFDVMPETWNKTRLGDLKPGHRVNVERAMRADGRFDGHIVQGHVEGVGEVLSIAPTPQPPPPRGEGAHKALEGERYPAPLLINRSRHMRKAPTKSEAILWDAVRNHQLGYHIRRQRPIGKYILDFFCEEKLLGIEVDDKIHERQKEYDALRDRELHALGIRMLHVTSEEVEHDTSAILERIRVALHVTPPPHGGGAGDGGILLEINLPPNLSPFVLPKGSITVDGVSLTVASLTPSGCTLALIPTTLRETTLGALRKGDRVNIETDILIRSIAALLPQT